MSDTSRTRVTVLRAMIDGAKDPAGSRPRAPKIDSECGEFRSSRGALRARGSSGTRGSRRGIVQFFFSFFKRCLLTGVRNSVRDRLDVFFLGNPRRWSREFSREFSRVVSRELPRLVGVPCRSAAIKRNGN